MQIFKANKGNFWMYLVGAILLPILMLFINIEIIDNYWFIIPTILPFLLFLWIYQTTKYFIKGADFYYQSAFLRGKININKIKKIKSNTTMWSGIKPALATKGIIIFFGFDEVYVAPENNQVLIDALLQINPNIIVE